MAAIQNNPIAPNFPEIQQDRDLFALRDRLDSKITNFQIRLLSKKILEHAVFFSGMMSLNCSRFDGLSSTSTSISLLLTAIFMNVYKWINEREISLATQAYRCIANCEDKKAENLISSGVFFENSFSFQGKEINLMEHAARFGCVNVIKFLGFFWRPQFNPEILGYAANSETALWLMEFGADLNESSSSGSPLYLQIKKLFQCSKGIFLNFDENFFIDRYLNNSKCLDALEKKCTTINAYFESHAELQNSNEKFRSKRKLLKTMINIDTFQDCDKAQIKKVWHTVYNFFKKIPE